MKKCVKDIPIRKYSFNRRLDYLSGTINQTCCMFVVEKAIGLKFRREHIITYHLDELTRIASTVGW
jgi:NADH:ubiquinone oxidoreductase subunit D